MIPLSPGLAVILDMDGVLIDSNPIHRRAWEIFNGRYGLETTEAMHQRMYGKRNDQIILDFYGPGLTEQEIAARGSAKEQLYRELVGSRVEDHLVPGIRAFLEGTQEFPLGLATNAEPANVDFLLDKACLRKYFSTIIDGSQVEHPKPDPEVYLRTAGGLRTVPANCIVFEDSPSGVAAALAAGMRVIGVGTTFGKLPGTHHYVDNFRDGSLVPWLCAQRAVA